MVCLPLLKLINYPGMNILKGKIEYITVNKNLSLVNINVNGQLLSAIVIDNPETVPYLKPGNSIKIIFKETEVIIGKGKTDSISLQNKFTGTVESVETGELLSKLTLNTTVGKIISIITTNAVNQLVLKKGSEVTAMVKTNEIMLTE